LKILDRDYRLFGIINPIDAVVVLLVLAVGVVGYTLLRGGSSAPIVGGEDLVTVRATLLVREMRVGDVSIEKGDEVVKVGTGTMGEVTAVSLSPTLREVPTADGDLKVVESTLQQDATITVEGKGRFAKGGVMMGDVLLAVNEQIDVKTPRFSAKATVYSLEIVE